MNMSRRKIILSAIFLLSVSFLLMPGEVASRFNLLLGSTVYASAEENDTICKGVFIDEVDVSGMTKSEAESAVKDFIDGLKNKGVAISVGDNTVYATMSDLGYTGELNDMIDQALALGKSGNLIKRYKDLKDIEQGNFVYQIDFKYDESKIKNIVTNEVSAYNVAPVNATLSRKNGEFEYTDHVVGSKVNIDETTKLIEDAIQIWNRQDLVVNAVVEEDMPVYTKDILEECDTVLGTYSTEYADSAVGRANNLANGARLINNAVIYPGDTFSAYEYLTPFTEENGYYVAGAYLQGKVIDSVGGGACQVTTTLYNAVLGAELEVVERQPHSMTISYVELSRDAAIAGTYKDFKFKNNTDVPILIEAFTQGRKITFKIWGHETRDNKNRTIEYITKVLSETAPPADVITEDPTQPTTYRKVTQSAHTGYKAELYKVVYENGVEVSRTLVNKSNYSAAPRYVTVGTKVVEEEKKDDPKDKKPETPKKDDTASDTQDQTNAQTENQSVNPENQANPDDQMQIDLWDPVWDLDEPIED
jgi:vancomycin resistance protein YoaR